MKPSLHELIEVTITDIGIAGEGIGSFQGFKIFVPGALPSETVQVKIQEIKPKFALAKLIKLVRASPYRITPPCPVFHLCGGCQIMHLDYAQQLEVKRKRVTDALVRIGKISSVEVPSVEPSPHPLQYRNKIQLPISGSSGAMKIGLYARGSHQVVDIQQCLLHHPVGDQVFCQAAALIKACPILPYDEKTKKGELRHILIRTSNSLQQVLLVLVTTTRCSRVMQALAKELFAIPNVQGVVHHRNRREDNVILDREFTTLYGKNFIEDKICGLTFKVSAASFFQVNPMQAEHLYEQAIKYAEVRSDSIVLDAYCGIGTLSLLVAQKAKKVIGVESVSQAVTDAQENARINGIDHVEFIWGQSEQVIASLSAIDIVFLNPPRRGCDPRMLLELKRLSPETVVYISCDPATLARDAQTLTEYGFRQEAVHPFDMFPQTMHVETIAKFTRPVLS